MWVNQSNWKISTIARSLFLLTCFKKIPHELPTVMQASQTNAVVNYEALLCIFPEEKNAESCFVDRCCLLIIQKSHADFEINLITCFFITITASGWATGAVPLSSEQASAPTYLCSTYLELAWPAKKNEGRLDDFSKISKKIKQRVALAGGDGAPRCSFCLCLTYLPI